MNSVLDFDSIEIHYFSHEYLIDLLTRENSFH